MAIFNGYAKLPEGTMLLYDMGFSSHLCLVHWWRQVQHRRQRSLDALQLRKGWMALRRMVQVDPRWFHQPSYNDADHRCPRFPWLINRGAWLLPKKTTGIDDRLYTSHRPLYFYQKDIVRCSPQMVAELTHHRVLMKDMTIVIGV